MSDREEALTAILNLQSEEAVKAILKRGSDETTFNFLHVMASQYPLYLKGLLETGNYGLSEYDAKRLRQFVDMVIA